MQGKQLCQSLSAAKVALPWTIACAFCGYGDWQAGSSVALALCGAAAVSHLTLEGTHGVR
jgi:hypothetical protein